MLTNIAAIFGIIGGIIAVFTIVYMVGFWRRGIEDDIEQTKDGIAEIKDELKQHNLASFCLMVQTLWDVYVLDALHKRPDIAVSHSRPKLTQKGLDFIPEDIKERLDKLEISVKDWANISSGYLVVQVVGLDRITKLAGENALNIQEMIAVLSSYLSARLG